MIHDSLEIRQLIAPLFENKFWWGTIQADHQDFFSSIHEHLPFQELAYRNPAHLQFANKLISVKSA